MEQLNLIEVPKVVVPNDPFDSPLFEKVKAKTLNQFKKYVKENSYIEALYYLYMTEATGKDVVKPQSLSQITARVNWDLRVSAPAFGIKGVPKKFMGCYYTLLVVKHPEFRMKFTEKRR